MDGGQDEGEQFGELGGHPTIKQQAQQQMMRTDSGNNGVPAMVFGGCPKAHNRTGKLFEVVLVAEAHQMGICLMAMDL